MGPLGVGLVALAALAVEPPLAELGEFRRVGPRCPPSTKHCFGIELHVVVDEDEPVQTPRWFADNVRQATELFRPIDVAFEVVGVHAVDGTHAEIDTRRDRDLLGRNAFSIRVIHVFVVRRLADVDIDGAQIHGVHWRDRGDTSRRWIILSSIGKGRVLAHELGHFFGLPHSRYVESIMNKAERLEPPWEERVSARQEIARMRQRRDFMVSIGFLENRRRPTTG